MRIRRTHILVMLISALILLLPLVLRVPNPYGNPVVKEVHETSHTVLFFIAQLVLLLIVRRRRPAWPLVPVMVGTALAAAAIGGIIELIQPYFHRSRSWQDLGRDVLGIVAACGLYYCLSTRGRSTRGLALAVATLALAIAFAPLGKTWQRQWLRDDRFPVLADFEDALLRHHVGRTEYARISFRGAPAEWPGNRSEVLEVFMPKDTRWSGFALYHPVPRWRGFRWLRFEVFSPLSKTARIALNVYSIESGRKPLHYQSFEVAPGLNSLALKLNPDDAALQNQYINRLLWYSIAPERDTTLYFDNIRLSREDEEEASQSIPSDGQESL